MAASGVGSLIFIDEVTHDGYKNILFANLRGNASKLIGTNFIMQQDNDPKHTVNTTTGTPPEKQQLKEAAVKAWKSITKEESNGLVMRVTDFTQFLQARDILPNIKRHLLKYSLFQTFFSPKNWVV